MSTWPDTRLLDLLGIEVPISSSADGRGERPLPWSSTPMRPARSARCRRQP